jgi:hypothetical protein
MLSSPVYTDLQENEMEGLRPSCQPMYAKVREHGAPVRGERLGGKPGKRRAK